MSNLSEKDLLLLNSLIYINKCQEGNTITEILNQYKSNGEFDITKIPNDDYTSSSEYLSVLKEINNSPNLCNLKIVSSTKNDPNGMRAACFVDKDTNAATVVFRGTGDTYEWEDNLKGAYITDTDSQKAALDFVNNIDSKYQDITVSGHSKGANKAQYVTLFSDRVSNCIAFDGQGFSDDFLKLYATEISNNKGKIKAINSYMDVVSALMFPIAGEVIYIESDTQKNILAYHRPYALFKGFDENGNYKKPFAEQWEIAKLIQDYTQNVISKMPEPPKSAVSDILTKNVIIPLKDGDDSTGVIWDEKLILAGIPLLTYLDDAIFDYIKDEYGVGVEIAVTYLSAVLFPYLFMDDFVEALKDGAEVLYQKILELGEKITEKLKELGDKAREFANAFKDAVMNFANSIKMWYDKNFNIGYKYATANPQITVDTYKLKSYASRLIAVNNRLSKVDRRLDALYSQVGLLDLWSLLRADFKIGWSNRINRSATYLNDTASDFEAVERSITAQLG